MNITVSAGQTSGGPVVNGGTITVLSGGITSGLLLEPGYEVVFLGGLASRTVVSGGILSVSSGGLASNAIIDPYNGEYVFSGGTDRGATLITATQEVEGGVASGAVLSGQSYQIVMSGGQAVDTILRTSSLLTIVSGAASGVIVSSGGEAVIGAGQTASGGVVSSGGLEVVSSGATLSAAEVLSGGTIVLLPGAQVVGTISGGGSVVSADILMTSGTDLVSALSGVVSGLLVPQGPGLVSDYAVVLSGGSLVSAVVSGVVNVGSGGITVSGMLSRDGTEHVLAGGTDSGSLLSGNGAEIVDAGGVTSGVVLDGPDTEQIVSAGGSAVGTIVLAGDQEVWQGGTAIGTVVASGALLQTAGFVSGAVFGSGAYGDIGGVIVSTLIESGAEVLLAGVASNTVMRGGYVFVYAGSQDIDPVLSSGALEAVSATGIVSGATVLSGATLVLEPGAVQIGTVSAGGTVISADVIVSSGRNDHVVLSAYSGAASGLTVVSGDTAVVLSGGSVTSTVVQAGGVLAATSGPAFDTVVQSGGLVVGPGGSASGTVLQVGGELGIVTSVFFNSATVAFNSATDVLTVSAGGVSYAQVLGGSYINEYFEITNGSNAYNALFVTVTNTPCYCRGTRIMTVRGEVAVEELAIGDHVVTAFGEVRPIKWLGRRSYAGWLIADNPNMLPVCFKQGALGDGIPARDLWVSPDHAMFLDGCLVPAGLLVNHASIFRAERVEEVHYIHVELPTHDVLLAEGAPSESFVDDDSRLLFHNAADYFERYSGAAHAPALYCAPRVTEGYTLERIRQRLGERAFIRAPLRAIPLRGYIDHVGADQLKGWAQNPEQREAPVCLDILVDGKVVMQTLANRYRRDLERAGIGSGWHSFAVALPVGLTAAQIASLVVRRSMDGAELPRSATARQAA